MEEGYAIEEWPKIDWNARVLFRELPVQSPIFNIREMVCHLYFEEKSDRRTSEKYFELILRGRSTEPPEFISFYTKTYIRDMHQNIRFEEDNVVRRTEKSFEYCIWRVNKEWLLKTRYDMVGDCEWLNFICLFGPSLENPSYKKIELELRKSFNKSTTMEIMSRDYMKLLHKGLMSDVSIVCSDGTMPAHKFLLTVRCKTFAEVLRRDRVIRLSNMRFSEVSQILSYIYSGRLPEITLENMCIIYEASHEFQLDALKMGCANFMLRELTVRNALGYLNYAQKCNDTMLKLALGAFFRFSKLFLKPPVWEDVHYQYRAITSWSLEDENIIRILPNITLSG